MLTLHELPRHVYSTRWGKLLFSLIAAAFVSHHVHSLVQPLLASSRMHFPWGMFGVRSGPTREFRAIGITPKGERVDIAMERWFHYRRGFSSHTLVYQHPAMRGKRASHKRTRAKFARWLAQRVWIEDRVRLKEVRLEYWTWAFKTKKLRKRTLSSVKIHRKSYRAAERGSRERLK